MSRPRLALPQHVAADVKLLVDGPPRATALRGLPTQDTICIPRAWLNAWHSTVETWGRIVEVGFKGSARALLPLLFASVSLASCGGDDSPGSPSSGAPAPSPTPSPGPTPPPTGGYHALSPTPSETYSYSIGGTAGFGYNGDPATGLIVPNSAISGESPKVALRYDHDRQTYDLVSLVFATGPDRHVMFSTPKGATDPRYTDSRFLGYFGPAAGASPDTTGILRLYRPASTNPELKLTYSSFGNLARRGPVDHLNFGDFWFAYGVDTKGEEIATSGTGVYSGVMHGFAVDPAGGRQFKIEGSSSITLDYGTRKASGSVTMTLIAADGARISIGSATFSDQGFSSAVGTTSPTITGGTLTGPEIPHLNLVARLYGPEAREIAGKLSGVISAGPTYGELSMVGAFAVAK